MLARVPLLAALGAGIGLVALRLRRPRPAADGLDPRALELRRRLDEARDRPTAEEPAASEPPAGDGLDARRRDVHEEGRRAAERMRPPGEDAS